MSLIKRLLSFTSVTSDSAAVVNHVEDDNDVYSASERAFQSMPLDEQDYMHMQTHNIDYHHDDNCEVA